MGQFYGRSHHGMVLRCDAALVDHFLCHGAQALNLLLPMGGQWVAHWPTGIHWLDLIWFTWENRSTTFHSTVSFMVIVVLTSWLGCLPILLPNSGTLTYGGGPSRIPKIAQDWDLLGLTSALALQLELILDSELLILWRFWRFTTNLIQPVVLSGRSLPGTFRSKLLYLLISSCSFEKVSEMNLRVSQ